MEPVTLTLAGVVIYVLMGMSNGALSRVGEMAADGSIAQFKRIIEAKYPDFFRKLEAANANPDTLPETIDVMATLIDNDAEIRAIAEQVAKENQSQPYVINQMKNVGIVNQGTINNPIFNFN